MSSKTVAGLTTTYGYDHADELTSESNSGYSATYTYDDNGNRTSKTTGGVTDTYTYDHADKLQSTSFKTYGYDGAGRTTSVTTSAGTTSLSYDYEDRLTSVTLPSSVTDTFTYNGMDARTGKVDSTGTYSFKRDGATVTSSVLNDSAAEYTPGVSENRSGTSSFYDCDRLGSTTDITNSSQTVTNTKVYDAFGMLLSSTGSSAAPFGFVAKGGYQSDSDTGLMLLGHRYYDPSTGRFLTRDHAKDGGNWYDYAGNEPTKYVDPEGKWWVEWWRVSVMLFWQFVGLYNRVIAPFIPNGPVITEGPSVPIEKLEYPPEIEDQQTGEPEQVEDKGGEALKEMREGDGEKLIAPEGSGPGGAGADAVAGGTEGVTVLGILGAILDGVGSEIFPMIYTQPQGGKQMC